MVCVRVGMQSQNTGDNGFGGASATLHKISVHPFTNTAAVNFGAHFRDDDPHGS